MNSMTMEAGTELAVMQQPLQAVAIFAPGGVDDILAKLKSEVRAIPTDISTPAGRKHVASLAYKVARSKTALDDLGKDLVAEWKEKAKKVDEDRRRIRDELDALKDEVRKPLTDWENAEQARVQAHERELASLSTLAIFDSAEPDIDLIQARLAEAAQVDRDWQEFSARATQAQAAVIESLTGLLERRKKQEAERAELRRLQVEEEVRRKREHEERIAREAAERAKREAEEAAAKAAKEQAEREAAERKRIQDEAAARERAEREAREKAEREKAEAEAKARKAEQDRIAAEQKAERDRKEAAERAEREKQEAIEAERKRAAEEQERQRKEAEAREKDRAHKARVNNVALVQMISAISPVHSGTRDEAEAICKAIIKAIAAGDVPNVKINY